VTGLLTGLRFGELAALRPDDVDLARGLLRVERTVSDRHRIEPVKDGTPRLGRMSPTLRAILAAHVARLTPGATILFPTKAGGRLAHPYFITRLWNRCSRRPASPTGGADRQARAVEGLDRALGLAPTRAPAPPDGEDAR